MPEVDDREPQLRVQDAREHVADVVGRGEVALSTMVNKTRRDLENMPDCAGTVKEMDLLAVLEGARRRDALLDVPGARRLDERAAPRPELAERLGLHANTVRLHLERLREAGLVDVERGPPRHGRAARSTSTRSRRARPGSGSTRPATRCSPACSRRWPSGSAPTAIDATAAGRAWGVEAGTPHPLTLVREGAHGGDAPPRLRPRDRPSWATTTDIAFSHCPFRELAEAYPELVCNLHRGICEGVVEAVGGGSVEEFATLYDRDPCRVTVTTEVA